MATPIPDNAAAFTLGELAAAVGAVGAAVPEERAGERVAGIVTDSRRVAAGNVYVALVGEQHDGHDFLKAVAGVAAAAIVRTGTTVPAGLLALEVDDTLVALGDIARAHRRRWGGRIVAITGSAGKTTTKELAAGALGHDGRVVGRTAGNLNNRIGVPMTLLCLESSTTLAVIEAGTSLPGEIAALAGIIEPDIAVVTGVSVAHTAGLGSLDAVADEKMELLRAVGAEGTAIFSADHPALVQRAGSLRARTLSFGESPQADVRLVAHTVDAELRSTCTYAVPGRGTPAAVRLRLLGVGPAVDAAAALCCVLSCDGVDALDAAIAAMQEVAPVAGRLSPVDGPQGCAILDDTYNANPASASASLRALAESATARGGRSIAILGDMKELGSQSGVEHARVGRHAGELGLHTFVGCGEEMRAAVDAVQGETRALHVVEPMDALDLLEPPDAGDVILIKGSRSMKMERLVDAMTGVGA